MEIVLKHVLMDIIYQKIQIIKLIKKYVKVVIKDA